MRHRVKTKRLGRDYSHRKALLRNLATSLVLHERMETTEAKAKALQPVIEKLISHILKDEPREAIRKLNAYFYDKAASRKMMEILKPRYKDKKSGFTRIGAVKFRDGDSSKVCQIELIQD